MSHHLHLKSSTPGLARSFWRMAVCALLLLPVPHSVWAQTITTYAGGGSGVGDGGQATAASFSPFDVCVDADGNKYIASWHSRIRKVTPAGIINTIAGTGVSGTSPDGVLAAGAAIGSGSQSVAVDAAGNVYFTELFNGRIRKIDKVTGRLSTVGGNGTTSGTSSDGMQATNSPMMPLCIRFGPDGNLYYTCYATYRMRKINITTGVVTTIAGNGSYGTSTEGAIATATPLNMALGMAFDAAGNIYISEERGHVISVIKTNGRIYRFAGTGTSGYNGNGVATASQLNWPEFIAVDAGGNLLIPDSDNNRVRSVNIATGIMKTLVGNGSSSNTGDNGPASAAAIDYPTSVAVEPSTGNLYVAADDKVRKIVTCTPPAITVSAGSAICRGSSKILTASGGTTYSWSPATALSATTGASVTATPTVTTTYTVTGGTGTCTNTATVTVSVNALPSITTSSNSAICRGASATLTAAGGTSYSWAPGTSLSATSGSSVVATPAATTTYTVTGSNGTCTNTATVTTSVNPLPTISASDVASICFGASTALTASGGTSYSWAPGTGLSAVSGASVIADPSVTTTYTVTGSNGVCSNTATVMVSVTPLPSVIAGGSTTICDNQSTTLTAAGDVAFTWLPAGSLSSAAGASVVASPSANTIYTVTATSGSCTNTATVSVSVNPAPAVITGASATCLGGSTTLSCITPDGTWSASNANATVSPVGIVTAVAAGDVIIRYTLPSGCYKEHVFTINEQPTISAGDTVNICAGASASLNATGAGSYNWYPATGLSSSEGSSITASPAATTTYTVVGNSGPGCVDTTTVTVNVASSFPIGAGANVAICSGTSTVLSATGSATSFTWSPSTGLSATTGAVVVASPLSTTTYTLTGSLAGCTQVRTVTVSVNAAPGNISGTLQWCKNTTTTLSCTPAGGSWSCSQPSIGSVNSSTGVVYGAGGGTATIYYTKAGCSSSKEVTVLATPAIGGISSLCTGLTTTLTNAIPDGTWTSSIDTVATIDAATGLLTTIHDGVTTITYTAGTGCVATKQFTVGLPPAFTTGPWVCLGQTLQAAHPVSGGTWSSSNPAKATVDPTSGTIYGVSLGNFYISYTLGTGCVRTMEMAVQTYPMNISGAMSICKGASTTLGNETISGTWSSSDTTVASIALSAGSVIGLSAGTTNITYRFQACYRTEQLTVNPLPADITGTNEICEGVNIAYSSTPSGGTWASSAPAKASIGVSSGIASGVASGNTTLTYTAPLTGCRTIKSIIVKTQPGALSGITTLCAGNTTVITSASGGGTWSSSVETAATVGSTLALSTTVSALAAGTTTVTTTNGEGCSRSTVVTVNAAVPDINGDAVVCPGTTLALATAGTGGTWISSSTAATVGSATGIVTGVSAGTTKISYKTSATCYSIKDVTVNATPAAISGPAMVCIGSTVTLTHPETGGTWSSSMPARASVDPASGLVTGVSAGTLYITYTINSGCYKTFAINVNALPAAIVGPSSLCQGSVVSFTNVTTGGTWGSSNSSVASAPTTPGNVTGVSAGEATITYRVTATGCFATRDITVNAQPAAISGSNQLCISAPVTYSSAPSDGTWTSSMPARVTIDAASGLATGATAGAAILTYSLSSGCYRTLPVTVNALPAAIGGIASVCRLATTTLSNGTTGGTWSTSAATTASVSPSGVVTGVAAGTAYITYRLIATGCQSTRQVTVNELPAAISGPVQTCIGSTETFSSTPVGGTWLSSAAAVSIGAASGVATGISQGVTTITYTEPSASCRITKSVSVYALPAVLTATVTTVCVGNSITLTAGTAGQTWSATTAAISITPTSTTTASVTGISAGTAVVSYTNAYGCARTATITVNEAVAPITGDLVVCPSRTIALATTATGGTWSSALATKATVTSSGIVSGVNPGYVNISYTLSPGCFTYANVTINAIPAAITGPASVCPGDMIDLNHATSGGYWLSGNTAKAIVSEETGMVSGVAAGTSVITYAINSGCYVTTTVTVKAAPASISGMLSVGIGSTSTLTNATTGGTWSSSAPAIGSIGVTTGILTGVSTGNATITYRVTATQCYATAEATVTEAPAARAAVDEVTAPAGIHIYPNPTQGVLTIDAATPGTFTVYTIDGKLLQQYATIAPSTSVSLPHNIAAGVYTCRFESVDGATKIVRIVYQQ